MDLDDSSRTAGGAVEGTVFLDRSLDGVRDPDEPGLARGPDAIEVTDGVDHGGMDQRWR